MVNISSFSLLKGLSKGNNANQQSADTSLSIKAVKMARDAEEGKYSLPQTQAVWDRNVKIESHPGHRSSQPAGKYWRLAKYLPHFIRCRTSKGAGFLLSCLISTDCCTPRALSQQPACRGHESMNTSPFSPLSNTGARFKWSNWGQTGNVNRCWGGYIYK